MAAPTPTARTTPTGTMLDDGFSTKITLAADVDVDFMELSVTPIGFDGGDPIDNSTMFNTTYRTKVPQSLIEGTDGSGTATYDPAVYGQIIALINVETTITYTFPDGSTEAAYGYLQSFTPNELSIGELPTAAFVLVHTMNDSSDDSEAAPVYTAPV